MGELVWLPRLAHSPAIRRSCVQDASGDSLDAVLCALQAAWGHARRGRDFGLPTGLDPLEGWIAGVPAAA